MNEPSGAALAALIPPPLLESTLHEGLALVLALGFSTLLSTLRSSLRFSLPTRTLAAESDEKRRVRLEPLLERADAYASSAGLLKATCDLVFTVILVSVIAGDGSLQLSDLGYAVAIGAPTLLFVTEAMPSSVARAWGDRLLLETLPTFHWLQLPLSPLVRALSVARSALLRAFSIEDDTSSRKIVEGLREVVKTTGAKSSTSELEETERELIENVMEFGDVDAAEVMTPRTEMTALSVDSSVEEALAKLAEAGHSRLPVYEENVDNIIGTVTAVALAEATVVSSEVSELRELLRPPMLVPETKLVSELLREFRARKQKLAIVVDEYGGTAGVVTLTDVLAEIVGTIQDEYEEAEDTLRALEDGSYEVQASLHVSEVNEALDLSIPEEEDFETLAGFVLAQLGHFPKAGESFSNGDTTYSVAEASDRRVLKVRVKRSA